MREVGWTNSVSIEKRRGSVGGAGAGAYERSEKV